ncbi:MAG: transcriptional repressor [Eubacteriales bacterium]|nr:transcriptional repressor [Eubacteriales bacterium]
MANLKYSRQREAIKTFLCGRKDHPTADTIYTAIRKQYPNISLGTVYRNLGLLTDLGEIRKISVGDGAEHFDYDTRPHSHFVCTQCHCVSDFETQIPEHIVQSAQKNFGGTIDGCSVSFHGICEKCMKRS